MRRLAVAALAVLALSGCAATDTDTTTLRVCQDVTRMSGTVVDQARGGAAQAAALHKTLGSLDGLLDVRDTDASDEVRGDALVLQLNVRTALADLAAHRQPSPGQLQDALATFRSRDCT